MSAFGTQKVVPASFFHCTGSSKIIQYYPTPSSSNNIIQHHHHPSSSSNTIIIIQHHHYSRHPPSSDNHGESKHIHYEIRHLNVHCATGVPCLCLNHIIPQIFFDRCFSQLHLSEGWSLTNIRIQGIAPLACSANA